MPPVGPLPSIEPIALEAGTAVRTPQEFLVTARWDQTSARDTLQKHLGAVVADLPGDALGTVGVIDETRCRKWGDHTPGVPRQYLGCVGKIDNGIVTVHIGVTKGTFPALLDADLLLPKAWAADRDRCREAGIPDDVGHRTKWRLAVDQWLRLSGNGLSFDWLTFDEGYGAAVPFLRFLNLVNQRFVAEVPVNFSVREKVGAKARRADARLSADDARGGKRHRIAHRAVRASFWRAATATVWVAGREHTPIAAVNEATAEVKYFLTNATTAPLARALAVAFRRWTVEHAFRLGKQEAGLMDYEGRHDTGLVRHLILASVVLGFVATHTERLRGEKPGGDGGTGVPGAEPAVRGGAPTAAPSSRGAAHQQRHPLPPAAKRSGRQVPQEATAQMCAVDPRCTARVPSTTRLPPSSCIGIWTRRIGSSSDATKQLQPGKGATSMRIARIEVRNFRNFRHLDLKIGRHAVIVGENKIGKSNLLFALQLILDPALSDSDRCLREEDFWDGLPRPLTAGDRIEVSVEFSEFEGNNDHLALLGEFLVQPDPMVARLTYAFQPLPNLTDGPKKESDYEFAIYGGGRPECRVGYELRKKLPLNLLPALRDAVGDLANWRKSPLRPLLDKAAGEMDRDRLRELAQGVSDATAALAGADEVRAVGDLISGRLLEMVGSLHALEMSLGFSPSDGERLIRTLRLFIDGRRRTVADASLGSANLLYLALKALQLDQQVAEGERSHTFLAIEEPEAHLHPHVQRRVYRSFLRPRQPVPPTEGGDGKPTSETTILLTTHSPNIVSVSPVHSLVLLRKSADLISTEGVSTANLELDAAEADDIERYLDVTRGEVLFARGVLLVEGEAEQYMLPVLAELNGYKLDELGITVCSVGGTHFLPYLKFLGPTGLNIPSAVITDSDPDEDGVSEGFSRLARIFAGLDPHGQAFLTEDEAKKKGMFLTDHTFEIALFRSGRQVGFANTMEEFSSVKVAKKRAAAWKADPKSLDAGQLLKDIEAIGKGRFAQRWAQHVSRSKSKGSPKSVLEAIEYVASRVRFPPVPEVGDGTEEEP